LSTIEVPVADSEINPFLFSKNRISEDRLIPIKIGFRSLNDL